MVYCEWYRSQKDALKREKQLKKHKTGWAKLKERIKNSILLPPPLRGGGEEQS
jgi:predicted GIY-YIG superfamily endonuclease